MFVISLLFSFDSNSSRKVSPLSVELSRIVERGIRECRALDREALAIIAGEKVWSINCVIHVFENCGNLPDMISLAAIGALMHFRRPEVSVVNGNVHVFDPKEKPLVALSLHHIPVSISFYFYQEDDMDEPVIIADPTEKEEKVLHGSITFTFNSYKELCSVHKIGGLPISSSTILKCANLAQVEAVKVTELLKKSVDDANQLIMEETTAELRGRAFQGNSLQDIKPAEEVNAGDMTDYGKLHAPIPLAVENVAQKEQNSIKIQNLMSGLEASSAVGLEISSTAREDFKKQTAEFLEKEKLEIGKEDPVIKKEVGICDSDGEEEKDVIMKSEFDESHQVSSTRKSSFSEGDSSSDDDLCGAVIKK